MTVDLRTCVPGQLVELRDGRIVRYDSKNQDTVYPHLVDDSSRTDEGYYYSCREEDEDDVVKILPLDKPESSKSDKHPSVAWWDSCPWITDRLPTVEDTSQDYVAARSMVLVCKNGGVTLKWYTQVMENEMWIHMNTWKPYNQTPKEKALALIANHEDGWIPTPDQWNIIREGLAE